MTDPGTIEANQDKDLFSKAIIERAESQSNAGKILEVKFQLHSAPVTIVTG